MLLENKATSDGFFQRCHKELRSSLSDVILKNFTNIEEDDRRVSFIENLPQVKEFFDGLKVLKDDSRMSAVSGKKDLARARMLKDEGNGAVSKGDWTTALTFYTKSILCMPYENGSELSIVFANRSAALYHLQKYEASLYDINMAISLHYPCDLKYKVLDRRARCYLALNWNVDAIHAFKETISSLDSAKLTGEKRHKMQTDAQVMVEILNKSFQLLNTKNKEINQVLHGSHEKMETVSLPNVSGKVNKTYNAASEAISIEKNNIEGRFAVSNRDISAGEIVVVEKPHCSVLLAEYAQTHCFHCFKRCINPLPCHTCSNIIFCTIECRQQAMDTYHKYECQMLKIIWDSGCSVTCHMALRIIMQRSLSYFKDLKTKLKEPLEGKFLYDDYKCVYNLVGHENKRSKADLFQRTHMAVFLLSLLKKTDYFKSTDVKANGSNCCHKTSVNDEMANGNIPDVHSKCMEIDEESASYIGSLILKNLQILQFNAHEIFELQCVKPIDNKILLRKDQGKTVFLGGGLYPTLALFNHSCEPSVTRYFQGTSVIVQMVKNIKSGQRVSENYGPLFTRKAHNERREELKDQYWFECHCVACEQKWPMFEDMDETIMRFKCDAGGNCPNVIPVPTDCNEFLVKCGLCEKHTNIMKGLKSLQDTTKAQKTGVQHMEKGEYGKALVKFVEELKLYDETLAPPFKDYHLCQQNIRRCLLTFGNCSVE